MLVWVECFVVMIFDMDDFKVLMDYNICVMVEFVIVMMCMWELEVI